MTDPSLWNQLLVWPIVNLLMALYKLFEVLSFPSPLVFAIVGMTIVIRLLLYPLTKTQLRSAKSMQALKPKLDELSKRYKNDKTALQKAQLELYKEHNVNPAAGCLPLLIQFPVLIALYRVFFQLLSASDTTAFVSEINAILYSPLLHIQKLDLSLFGSTLAAKPSEWQTYGLWLLTVPVITGALQWYQTKIMLPATSQSTEEKNPKKHDSKEKEVDTQQELQKQMALITPIMFGIFAYQFPLGLSLYWNVFGIFGIIQQISINKHE